MLLDDELEPGSLLSEYQTRRYTHMGLIENSVVPTSCQLQHRPVEDALLLEWATGPWDYK